MADEAGPTAPEAVLSAACREQRPAILFSAGLTRPCSASFVRLADGIVTLDVITELPEEALQILSLCFVAFHHGKRTRVFVAQVLETERVDGHRHVGLAVPEQIASQEARIALRVPVADVAGFAVALELGGGRQVHPEPVNVSMSGMLVRFGPSSDPKLAIGDRLAVEMVLRGKTVRLDPVVVRRKSDHDYGLFFSEAVRAGKVEPPEDLAAIVESLQREWLGGRDS